MKWQHNAWGMRANLAQHGECYQVMTEVEVDRLILDR